MPTTARDPPHLLTELICQVCARFQVLVKIGVYWSSAHQLPANHPRQQSRLACPHLGESPQRAAHNLLASVTALAQVDREVRNTQLEGGVPDNKTKREHEVEERGERISRGSWDRGETSDRHSLEVEFLHGRQQASSRDIWRHLRSV